MPKLEVRNCNPLFTLNNSDAEKIATETLRRRHSQESTEASSKAREYAVLLLGNRQHTLVESPVAKALADGSFVSARDCSRLIDLLKPLPYRPRQADAAPAPVTEGFYKLGDDFVKVQEAKNGSGRLYAKSWDGYNWAYQPGLVRKLVPEDALTPEQAKEWGDLYGCCIYCSRDLTDERSISAGYGPTCAEKRGLPWG